MVGWITDAGLVAAEVSVTRVPRTLMGRRGREPPIDILMFCAKAPRLEGGELLCRN